jgi:hypothetical protein
MTTLADVFASVTVTPEQGVMILGTMAADYADRDPELMKSIQDAISKVTDPAPPPSGSGTTKTSTSSTSSS